MILNSNFEDKKGSLSMIIDESVIMVPSSEVFKRKLNRIMSTQMVEQVRLVEDEVGSTETTYDAVEVVNQPHC